MLTIYKYIRNDSGLTVVELMIALSILMLVLALGFNFIFFGVQAFGTGEERTLVQYNVRLASRMITDELRYADNVEIYSAVPAHSSLIRAIYLTESGQVVIRDEAGLEKPLSGQLSNEVNFNQLSFSVNPDNSKMLLFSIAADRNGKQQYQLDSEVAPLNQRRSIFNNAGEATGIAIVYMIVPADDLPTLTVTPPLVTLMEGSQTETFELLLTGEIFGDLTPSGISLSGPAFDPPGDFNIAVVEGTVTATGADISITGDYQVGRGTITVYSTALEGNYDLSADIEAVPNLVFITDESLTLGTVGEPYLHQLSVVGGAVPYSFYLGEICDLSGTCAQTYLPAGLSLDTSTGKVQGEHVVGPAGDYVVVIGVIDDAEESHEREYILTIENRQYNLTIGTVGPGATNPGMGNYSHDYDDEVTITATPDSGALFSGWSGLGESGYTVDEENNTLILTVTADTFITATFDYQYPPLSTIAGGSYLKDSAGNYYIKLTGSHDKVLIYNAEATTKKMNQLNSGEIATLPTLEELSGDLFNDVIRQEPNGRSYWTRTETNSNNVYYYIDTNGSVKTAQHSSDYYLRKIQLFTGALVDLKDGTFANPHIIIQ